MTTKRRVKLRCSCDALGQGIGPECRDRCSWLTISEHGDGAEAGPLMQLALPTLDLGHMDTEFDVEQVTYTVDLGSLEAGAGM